MAVIYLRHPTHGVKVACSDLEAAYDEQNGWERFDINEPSSPVDDTPAPQENALPVRRKRRAEGV
jgi:hypothetical protein